MRELVQQSRQEFLTQGQALANLRGQAQQEVAALRDYAAETRSAIEALRAASSNELQALHGTLRAVQVQIQDLEQRLRDAVSAISAVGWRQQQQQQQQPQQQPQVGPPPTSTLTSWPSPSPPLPAASWASWSAPEGGSASWVSRGAYPAGGSASWTPAHGRAADRAPGATGAPSARETYAGPWRGGAADSRGSWGGAWTGTDPRGTWSSTAYPRYGWQQYMGWRCAPRSG